MELISVQQLVSGDRYEGKVRAFEVLARGAAQEPDGWRRGVAGVQDAVSEEKQKVKEDRRRKLETLDNSRVRLESLQDLEAIVRLRKQKRSRKRVCPKEPKPEPAVPAEPVDAAQFLQAVLENQIPMVDKYLADGGDPDVHDQVHGAALGLPPGPFRDSGQAARSWSQAGAQGHAGGHAHALGLPWGAPGRSPTPAGQRSQDLHAGQGERLVLAAKLGQHRGLCHGRESSWSPGCVAEGVPLGTLLGGGFPWGSSHHPPMGQAPSLLSGSHFDASLGSHPAPSHLPYITPATCLHFPSLPVLNGGVQ
ncbi:ankyrin repeat domain-containing protein 23 isoform 2-T2 [Pangshura tecta]